MATPIGRREFIVALGGSAGWASSVRAQYGTRVRRVGALMVGSSSDSQVQAQVAAFREGLEKLGWVEGRNIRIDSRFAAANSGRLQEYAAEFVRSKSDVVLVQSSVALAPVLRESRSVPIVFLQIYDPVDSGFVSSLARPRQSRLHGHGHRDFAAALCLPGQRDRVRCDLREGTRSEAELLGRSRAESRR